MIQIEFIDGLAHTYSDKGVYIHGGEPEADYTEAFDPVTSHRTYTETDRLIDLDAEEADDATEADYKEALSRFGVDVKEEDA